MEAKIWTGRRSQAGRRPQSQAQRQPLVASIYISFILCNSSGTIINDWLGHDFVDAAFVIACSTTNLVRTFVAIQYSFFSICNDVQYQFISARIQNTHRHVLLYFTNFIFSSF